MRYSISPIILATLAGSCVSNAAAQPVELFPAVIELSSLNGTNGFVLNGIDSSDTSGWSVSSAGDVNSDGMDDMIISAMQADPGGKSRAGESYVVFGGAGVGSSGAIELSLLDGTNGFVLNGIGAGDQSGFSASAAGDVNGDGVDDLIIGAIGGDPDRNASAGESYVVFGGVGVGSSGAIELSILDGTNGFVINGINAGDLSGSSVSSAGDVNGDGINDMIIGAYLADPNGNSDAGQCYVVFGGVGVGSTGVIELSSLDGTNGFVLNGIGAGDESGRSVSSAGDVNADGVDDLIIGARYADPNGITDAGQSYIVFGGVGVGSSGSIELSSLDGTNGFVLNGIDASDRCGSSVSLAGDLNDDGVGDMIIGAPLADPNGVSAAGESYVVFGGVGIGSSGAIEHSSLNGTNGFVANGVDANGWSGISVSSAGDVNGDGVDDMIVGASLATANGSSDAGINSVVFGSAGVGSSGVIEFASLDGTNGFVLNGISEFDRSGKAVSSVGDINGDGVDDIIIGAWQADPNGISDAGQSYVVFGRVPCPADVNGDGTLTAADFTAWIAAFNAMAPECDQNGDGACTPADFTAWIANYNAGC